MPDADEAGADRDEPRGAEAAPARRSRQPHCNAGTSDTRGINQKAARNPLGAIKTMFRQAVKAITRRTEDEPRPQTRRRRGESDRAFRMTAKAALRRMPRPPAIATAYLADTLDWLNLWANGNDDSELCDNLGAIQNDLSLRL